MLRNKAFLLLSGEKPNSFPDLKQYAIIAVTDGAYLTLKENGIKPHFISGDFDSLTETPKEIEMIHTPNQDFTDFYKALEILKGKGINHVDVYGASGKEQDHFLDNLSTALLWQERMQITFFDNYGCYFLATPKTEISNCLNKTVSLIPLPKATNILTEGLLYSLNNETLTFGKRTGSRNKAIKDTINIEYASGNLCIFIND